MTGVVNFLPGMAPSPGAGVLPGARGSHIRSSRLAPSEDVIGEAIVYRKDVVFKVKRRWNPHKPRLRERGDIKGFSAESARRLRHLIRNTDDLWTGFVTLTYPGPSFAFAPEKLDGPTCKKHIHAFCTWLGRKKIAYVWILEFQARGVPHFHFLVSGFIDKAEISRKWYDLVGSGDPRHLAAGTSVEGVKNPDQVGAYMGAYMSKLDQKTVPEGFEKVGRFWGASRCLSKTLYRMQGLYRDVARELRTWRKTNQGIRRGISAEQLAAAAARLAEIQTAGSDGEKRKLLRAARSCTWRAKGFAKRWTWKGRGFILLRGAITFRSILRQAVAHDRGLNPWEEWDGKPKVCKYESEAQKILKQGQFDLFEGFIPFHQPDPTYRFCVNCWSEITLDELGAHRNHDIRRDGEI